jgi:hypothetical protein
MIDKNKILNIPYDEKIFITPTHRDKFFLDLIKNYKNRYDNLKLIFAFLNKDAKSLLDYILIFKTKDIKNDLPLIVFDAPIIYSDRSLPGYRYCKRLEIEDDFFKESILNMVTMSEYRFNEFINSLNFSIDSNHDKFWKKKEYCEMISKQLLDLSLRYNKK